MRHSDTKREQIEREVSKTLQCLDNMETIETSPDFFSRLQDKIERLDSRRVHWFEAVFSKAGLRPAFLILMIVLNAYSAAMILQNGSHEIVDRQTNLETIAAEYNMIEDDDFQLPGNE